MKKLILISLFSSIIFTFNSCKKEYDEPPVKTIPTGNILDISELRQMYLDSVVNFAGTPEGGIRSYYKFQSDFSLFAVVSADEKSGNLYKNVYLKDNTGAMNISLIYSGGIYQGDSIRLNLKGTVLSNNGGMIIIDSVNVDNNITIQANQIKVEPMNVNLTDIDLSYEAKLVRISGVEMSGADIGTTWADAVTKASMNRTITDCQGNQMLVRTSGYSLFAGEAVPSGSGSITAVVGIYGSTIQLYIRNTSEVNMTGSRCSPLIVKDFEDEIVTSGGWTTYNKTGLQFWEVKYFGDNVLVISGYDGVNDNANEDWFISPKVEIAAGKTATLTFETATKYTGNPMEVLVSTNYNGGDPNTATWTSMIYTPSAGNFTWTPSGDVNLSSFVSNNVRIAYKYTSDTNNSATWELDDIKLTIQ